MAADLSRACSVRELAAVVHWLCTSCGLQPLRVDTLRSGHEWGRTDCRTFVAFVPGAPLHAAAHEVAHVRCGSAADHGPVWRAEYCRLCAMLAARQPR